MRSIKFTLVQFQNCLLFQINKQVGYDSDSEMRITTDIGTIYVSVCSCPEVSMDDGECYIYLRGDNQEGDNNVCRINVEEFHVDIETLKRSIVYALEKSTTAEQLRH